VSTYVSIGRNIGDEPMRAESWRDFRAAVAAVLEDNVGRLVSETVGRGYYGGAAEDTAVVVAEGSPALLARDDLERRLAILARRYGQESIALTIGEPTFVPAS